MTHHTHSLILYMHTNTDTCTQKAICTVLCRGHILYYINKLTRVAGDAPTQTHVLPVFVILYIYIFFCLFPVLSLTRPPLFLSQIASLPSTLSSLLDFLPKQAHFLLNGAFLWFSLSLYPSTWLLSCCTEPFILCL